MSTLNATGAHTGLVLLLMVILVTAGCLGGGADERDNPNQPPVALFDLSAGKVRIGGAITVNASAALDVDGFLRSYTWDFGDGSTAVTKEDGFATTHTYATAGDFAIKLTVEDNSGKTASTLKWVEVKPSLPAGVEVNIVTKTNDIYNHQPGAGTSHNITDGGSTQYLVLVKNTGDEVDSYTLSSDALTPWSVTFAPAVLTDVAPGYQVYSVVTVTGSIEDTSLEFRATSGNNASVSAATRATTHIVDSFGATVPSAWTRAQIDYNLVNIGGSAGIDEDGWLWNQGSNFAGSHGGLITGFDNAIPGMREGQTKVIIVPPSQAYTDPSHALYDKTLIFEVTLVKVL